MIDDNVIKVTVREDRKYVIVEFPESQEFMDKDGVYFISGDNAPHSSYAVPVDMYEEWLNREENK